MNWVLVVCVTSCLCFYYTCAENHFGKNSDDVEVKKVPSYDGSQSLVVQYNESDFKEHLKLNPHFVMFRTPKCKVCNEIMPVLEAISAKLKEKRKGKPIVVATLDCADKNKQFCTEIGITDIPTLALFKYNLNPIIIFSGEFVSGNMKELVEEKISDLFKLDVQEWENGDNVMVLSDSNFASFKSVGRLFVKFFAPWCGHCQQLAPTWTHLAKSLIYDKSITIAEVDCTTSPQACRDQKILSYPTLIYFKNGEKQKTYEGPRDFESLNSFVSSMKVFKPKEQMVDLEPETFDETISTGANIVRFYDDECSNCQNSLDGWEELVEDITSSVEGIKMTMFNCRKFKSKCFEEKVYSVPLIVFYKSGAKLDIFRGSHYSKANLKEFIHNLKDKEIDDESLAHGSPAKKLTIETFHEMATSQRFLFVNFFVPWCSFSKAIAPIWRQLALEYREKKYISVAEVNCSEENKLCEIHEIRGYPSMLLFHEGKFIDMYTGSHDLPSIHNYFNMMIGQRQTTTHLHDEF